MLYVVIYIIFVVDSMPKCGLYTWLIIIMFSVLVFCLFVILVISRIAYMSKSMFSVREDKLNYSFSSHVLSVTCLKWFPLPLFTLRG